MGGGTWSTATYASTTRSKIDSGTAFAYSSTAKTRSASAWTAHEALDPKKLNAAGLNVRESCDSDEHPNALPIAVFFDETGSMGSIPVELQKDLGALYGTILRKGYAEDPQVLIGAYGDAETDRVPLQVSQFESDNRIDDNLDNLFLEGNGGGNGGESMALAWYYLAAHTTTDAFDKRGKKGYAFFIGDEVALPLSAQQVSAFVGDDEPLIGLSHKELVAKLLESWDAYVLIVDNRTAKMQGSVKFYTELFGADRVIVLENPESVSPTIALTIGYIEGTIDLDEGVDDLKSIGDAAAAARSVSKSLSVSGAGAKGTVTVSDLPPGL